MLPHPCKKDCPKRKAECASNCPEWAEYTAVRDRLYAARKLVNEVGPKSPEVHKLFSIDPVKPHDP